MAAARQESNGPGTRGRLRSAQSSHRPRRSRTLALARCGTVNKCRSVWLPHETATGSGARIMLQAIHRPHRLAELPKVLDEQLGYSHLHESRVIPPA